MYGQLEAQTELQQVLTDNIHDIVLMILLWFNDISARRILNFDLNVHLARVKQHST